MKKKLLLSIAAATVLCNSFTVCAAPQYMADGAVFDSEWYLQQYPDVATWSLGTSADALYQHYTLCGANEGRLPYDPSKTLDPTSILPYQGTQATTPQTQQPAATSQTQSNNAQKIMAEENETYQFPSIHSEKYNYLENIVDISYYKTSKEDIIDSIKEGYFPQSLSSYTLPGYEWKQINVEGTVNSDAKPLNLANMGDILDVHHNFMYGINIDGAVDNSVTKIKEDIGDWYTYEAKFTLNQDGVDYPECKLFAYAGGGVNERFMTNFYVLIPENYKGVLSLGYQGAKLENDKTIVNEASPMILFRF